MGDRNHIERKHPIGMTMDRKVTPAVECVSNLQLMTGATGAPAPESAVSQIQIPGINDGRKVIGKMKPETRNCGDSPVVGRKPTCSDSAAQLSLAPENICTDKGFVTHEVNLSTHNPDLTFLDSSVFDAVEAFLEAFVLSESDEKPEGSLPASVGSPEQVIITSTLEVGDDVE